MLDQYRENVERRFFYTLPKTNSENSAVFIKEANSEIGGLLQSAVFGVARFYVRFGFVRSDVSAIRV